MSKQLKANMRTDLDTEAREPIANVGSRSGRLHPCPAGTTELPRRVQNIDLRKQHLQPPNESKLAKELFSSDEEWNPRSP